MISNIIKTLLKAGELAVQERIRKRHKNKKQLYDLNALLALAKFILRPEGVRTFGEETARNNIYAGLVEIRVYEQHSSNGILVTQNGYFITTYHCVESASTMPSYIRLQEGTQYPVEHVCIRE